MSILSAGLAAAFAFIPLAAEAPQPDLPGLSLDRIVWGMTVEQIKAAYPSLGADASAVPHLVFGVPELSTPNIRFAGCVYDRSVQMETNETGAAEVDLLLQPDQPAECADKAITYITGVAGTPLLSQAGGTVEWVTPRTEILIEREIYNPTLKTRYIVAYKDRNQQLMTTRS